MMPTYITGRRAGQNYTIGFGPKAKPIVYVPGTDELHCLECQSPGVVTACYSQADKDAFIASHSNCRANKVGE